jgi:hypothetical protein
VFVGGSENVDPLHGVQVHSFSNAFSNVGDYVRSRPGVHEMKAQYSNRPRPPASISELVTRRWHAMGHIVALT